MSGKVRIATCTVPWFSTEETRAKQTDAVARAAMTLVEEAGRRGADIVCLPEFCLDNYNFKANHWIPQRAPGPATEALAAIAARHRIYIIAPLLEDIGKRKACNTAVLLDRSGETVGRYRKTHLCMRGFSEGETTEAGDELPVFRTDFGVIGISICMDIHYPELYTALALKGAEIIFWPTAAMDYTGNLLDSLVNDLREMAARTRGTLRRDHPPGGGTKPHFLRARWAEMQPKNDKRQRKKRI
ncbi:MAG: carbon-nitrogen hydrolase family protein [Verrucomicrobia bacterium]|nr:carbon-nitrogen hydrolase family protein [Verrucomicrobiota bacterium]